ncbi:MAG TPA: glutamine--fructose-6-phosphate transaminase (isomerizing) [Polyangiaceae bacterium]
MCGIVGYVGARPVTPILLQGLGKLEYRGYDSAGIAVHDGARVVVVRRVGKLSNLAQALQSNAPAGSLGIGHTRWATHGPPSERNAHPHTSGDVALVHNGIIENYMELRRALEQDGVHFSSETDTEVAAHLVKRALGSAGNLLEAVRLALRELRGAYAMAVMVAGEPSRLVVAKHASPLVIGLGAGENLCASDIAALLGETRRVMVLEDGELAELTPAGVRIETLEGERVERAERTIDWTPMQAEKAGYKHFMLKEIFEQPRAVADTVRGRVDPSEEDLVDAELGMSPEVTTRIDRAYLVACGTSFHASLVGRYWIEQLARLPAQAELASEVRYREPVFTERDLVVAVSQSGETADTLAAVQAARAGGAHVLAIANVVDSAIARASQGALYTRAGPEIGVASTKCFTAQLVALLMLAIYLGRRRGTLRPERARELIQALRELPAQLQTTLERADEYREVAARWKNAQHMLFLGRGLGFPIALEGALKLKEISYAHAEGYAAGEMKHGPIALIDETMPVVVVMPRDRYYPKILGNLEEARARNGRIIAVVSDDDQEGARLAEHVLKIPVSHESVLPVVTVVPLQLLAYFIADLRGSDVDQPRNLAKTVTVE